MPNESTPPRFLTTKEVAALLRVKERKIYDLAAEGAIPCTRATGKLLFPHAAIEEWIERHGAGAGVAPAAAAQPAVFLGSHDPLLDWALRESRAGLATAFDGSFDGLDRLARGEGTAAALHIHDPATGDWNTAAVEARAGRLPAVLAEWAWRARGLLVAPDNPLGIAGIADIAGRRVVPRQAEAASESLFRHMIAEAGIGGDAVVWLHPARTETDAAAQILNGAADAAFGLEAVARQYRLGFVPLLRERFDLLVWRRAWFEEPMQRLIGFSRTALFANKVAELGGYDVSGIWTVHRNGP